jgi:transcriptional regulatory protein LevR
VAEKPHLSVVASGQLQAVARLQIYHRISLSMVVHVCRLEQRLVRQACSSQFQKEEPHHRCQSLIHHHQDL